MTVIDMHNHFIAPEVIDFLAREGRHYATRIVERDRRRFFLIQEKALRPIDGPMSDAAARIKDMDREGITLQAISCVPFLMYPDVADDLGLGNRAGEQRRHGSVGDGRPGLFRPARFCPDAKPCSGGQGVGTRRQVGTPGVEVPPQVIERQLDESDFEVFWEAAEALGMAVCIHPFEAAPTGALARYFLGNLAGNLYDTGLAAALLIYGGVLERHPNLRIVLYHAGGALPSLVGRLDMGYRLVPECRDAIPRPPSTYVSQFHFDIIAHNREC